MIRLRAEGVRAQAMALLVRHVVTVCEADLIEGAVVTVGLDWIQSRRLLLVSNR